MMIHEQISSQRSILGVPVDVFSTYEDAVQLIRQRIHARKRTFCVAVNPEKIYKASRDSKLKSILDQADVRICDGIGLSLASQVLHREPLPRCTGIDLFLKLIGICATERWSIFLLGASPESNEGAAGAIARMAPGLTVAGTQHGFFTDGDRVIENINRSGADLLFVAMGSPRQELWISENMPRLKPTFYMGVGGSLDVLAGVVRRAPAAFRNTGTEWLFRLLSDPRRIRRQASLPLFAWDVLKARFENGKGPTL